MNSHRSSLTAALSLTAIALSAVSVNTASAQQASPSRPDGQTTNPSPPKKSDQSSPSQESLSSTHQQNRDGAQTSGSNRQVQVAAPDAADHSVRHYSGQQITGADGQKHGAFKDVAIDPVSGRIDLVIIDTGEALIAVPWEALQASAAADGFTVPAPGVTWSEVPSVSREEYDSGKINVDADERSAMARQFGPTRSSAKQNVQLMCANEIQGKSVRADDKDVGTIEDVVVDRDTGVVAALIDPSPEFASSNARFLVPLGRLELAEPQGDVIVANIAPSDFAQARPVPRSTTASQITTRPDESRLTPTGRESADQKPGPTAAAVLAAGDAVSKALATDPTFSAAAIEVTTESGKVVLRGAVDSEQAQQNIERAARAAAPLVPIDSKITVKRP